MKRDSSWDNDKQVLFNWPTATGIATGALVSEKSIFPTIELAVSNLQELMKEKVYDN